VAFDNQPPVEEQIDANFEGASVPVHELAVGRRRLRVELEQQQRRGHGRPRRVDRWCDG
jgi:hypothetical protein